MIKCRDCGTRIYFVNRGENCYAMEFKLRIHHRCSEYFEKMEKLIDKFKQDCIEKELEYQKIQEKFIQKTMEYDMYFQENDVWKLILKDFHEGLDNVLNDIQGDGEHLCAMENFIKKYRDCNKFTNSELVQMEYYVIHSVKEIFYVSLQHLRNTGGGLY